MKQFLLPFSFMALLCVSISCQPSGKGDAKDALAAHIDMLIKPGEDFFMYANGKWFSKNPIAPSEQSSGIWQVIQDTINSQVLKICKSSASVENPEKGSNKQKIGDFYFSGMDSIKLNSTGILAIQKYMDQIDDITDFIQLASVASFVHRSAGSSLFDFGVWQDSKISSKNGSSDHARRTESPRTFLLFRY